MHYTEFDECDGMSREEWLEYRREISREEREEEVEHQTKMIFQRLIGIGMLLLSVLIFVVASFLSQYHWDYTCCSQKSAA